MNTQREVKEKIVALLSEALAKAQSQGKLPGVPLPEVTLERPQRPEHGDYASSIALKLARAAGVNPMTIALELVSLMPKSPEVKSVEVAAPGFINFTLKDDWLTGQVGAILEAGESFGGSNLGKGSRIQIEFVSVNPTGPLHVGHGRGAVLGSTLANVLEASGYRVEKEYYLNDAGSQVDAFYRSLYVRYLECFGKKAEMPANGYMGSYMVDLAKELASEFGDKFLKVPEAEAVSALGEIGLRRMIEAIKRDLVRLGVTFDVWFSEKSLYAGGDYNEVMAQLKKAGFIAEKERATWFVSTALGEDKDNVVVRSDGSPTYLAGDIAYHYNKFLKRKFDQVIDIWGADHQGHVPRMKAVAAALGVSAERFKVIISQLVTLRRGKEIVRLSKRSGDIITLSEVMDEVGVDACRYFFLCRSADAQMDFDLELAKKESAENPVYYVQYAHARIASILKLAQEKNIDFRDGDVSLLTSEPELGLIRRLVMLPEMIELAARTLGVHCLPYYALELATAFHCFYRDCRVVSDDVALTKARLKLVSAAKLVLARTLGLMGMTAPDSM
ncbi:MAG: arginine--tRNA ligase [Chloroflexota bacterium]